LIGPCAGAYEGGAIEGDVAGFIEAAKLEGAGQIAGEVGTREEDAGLKGFQENTGPLRFTDFSAIGGGDFREAGVKKLHGEFLF
jgi:hypothetical protein